MAQLPSGQADPSHALLRDALRDALVELARRSNDPVDYLHLARPELYEALSKLALPDGGPDRDATREQIAQALDVVWPEVIASFAN